jgi:hypothetical protein
MSDIHITADYHDGDHYVSRTYKASAAQERALEHMDPRLEGKALDTWLSAQGAKLDDQNGRPASVTRYDDGRDVTTNYKDGKPGATVTDQHVTATYREGDHTVSKIYKVTDDVASELAQAKPQPTGQDLDKWLVAHGGKLDDQGGGGYGHTTYAVKTKYDDGASSEVGYQDGQPTGNSGMTAAPRAAFNTAAERPAKGQAPAAGSDADTTAKANALLTILTGGLWLGAMPFEGHGSKFAGTPQPAAPADTANAAPATSGGTGPKTRNAGAAPPAVPKNN